jgi:two-component system, OmpR family, response regulator
MKEKILLVEDDFQIANIMKEYLSGIGYRVIWVATGKEGLEDFKIDQYDLVIIDLMIPELDGFKLCKNLRLISEIPLIIVSAKKTEDDKIQGLKLGADDYITKPFSLKELGARIESQLRRYRRYHSKNLIEDNKIPKLYKNDLLIDEVNKIVTLKSEEVLFTAKEYELFIFLANHPIQIFSKKELYEAIWGLDDIENNNTLTVHIKQIREKIKDGSKHPIFIETVWGRGYRFIGEEIQ